MRLAQILLGVPKYRTPKPIKMLRRFGHTKLWAYNDKIVACKTCGNPHTIETVCGECYAVTKRETDRIKVEEMGLHKRA